MSLSLKITQLMYALVLVFWDSLSHALYTQEQRSIVIASGLGLHCSKVRPLPALEFSVSSSTIVRIVDLVLNLQTTSIPLKFVESHHFREKTIQSNVGFIVWHLLLLEKMHVCPSSNQACKKRSACNWEVFFIFCYSTAQGLEVHVLSPSAKNEVLITRSSC